jgi:hypothetical protein
MREYANFYLFQTLKNENEYVKKKKNSNNNASCKIKHKK